MRDSYWSDIESQLKEIFYRIVFKPVMDVLRTATVQAPERREFKNAKGDVSLIAAAIRSGRIQYAAGVFSGEFNAAISRQLKGIGAVWDSRSSVYRLDVSQVPGILRAESAAYLTVTESTHKTLLSKLDDVQRNLDLQMESVEIDSSYAIHSIEKGWKSNAKILEVSPRLSKQATEELQKSYNENLKLYIRRFSQDSVKSLRAVVEENAMQGYRFDKLIEQIRHRYGVTANKARFLARQETSLFMSKYQQRRYQDAGVVKYQWSTSHDERVRHSHASLDGKIFRFDSPPNTAGPGEAIRKNNPGEDFNCRCVAIPILESIE